MPARKGFIKFTHTVITQPRWFSAHYPWPLKFSQHALDSLKITRQLQRCALHSQLSGGFIATNTSRYWVLEVINLKCYFRICSNKNTSRAISGRKEEKEKSSIVNATVWELKPILALTTTFLAVVLCARVALTSLCCTCAELNLAKS